MSNPMNIVFCATAGKFVCDLQFFLSRIGYKPQSAREARDVCELARSSHPKMLFVEDQPGESDGFAVCREIRRDAELARIPLALITQGSPHHYLHEASRAGINYILQLPAAFNDVGVDLYTLVTSSPDERLEGMTSLRALVRVPRFKQAPNQATEHPWYPVDGEIKSHQVGDHAPAEAAMGGSPAAALDSEPATEPSLVLTPPTNSEMTEEDAKELIGVTDLLRQVQECFRDTRKRLDAVIQYIEVVSEKRSQPYGR